MTSPSVEHLRGLAAHLEASIIGQTEVLPAVVAALQNGALGLTDQRRPKGTFLFLGPTGVGKTELCLTFTDYLLGPGKLIRLDMSEYQTPSTIGLLLGRHEKDTGLIAKRCQETGHEGTLLFDEIEKAHPRVLDLLLQVLDAARMTTARGEVVDFSGYFIVCTSNIAAQVMQQARRSLRATFVRLVEAQAQTQLRPEVYVRFQCVCVFSQLGFDEQVAIAQALLDRELKRRRDSNGYHIQYDAEVPRFLAGEGFHPKLGARPMRNKVESLVREAIRERLLQGKNVEGCLQVLATDRKLRLT